MKSGRAWRSSRGDLPSAVLALLGGGVLALQSYLNGRASLILGSSSLAAAMSTSIGLLGLLTIGSARGQVWTGLRDLWTSPDRRLWIMSGGIFGGFLVVMSAYSAPIIGVALLTLAVVSGQTAGGLLVDGAGIGPRGRIAPSWMRGLGVMIAVLAVTLGAVTFKGHVSALLLAVLILAGVGFSFQQAAMGRITNITQHAVVGATVSFGVATAGLWVAALVETGGSSPSEWGSGAIVVISGPMGALVASIMAGVGPKLGVLRMSLALVSGQTIAGTILDWVAPAKGASVSIWSLLAVALTVLAVAVTSPRPHSGTA